MVDYAKLADKAKRDAGCRKRCLANKHKELKVDPRAFFERVRTHLLEEMTRPMWSFARGMPSGFARNHMPGFDRRDVYHLRNRFAVQSPAGIRGGSMPHHGCDQRSSQRIRAIAEGVSLRRGRFEQETVPAKTAGCQLPGLARRRSPKRLFRAFFRHISLICLAVAAAKTGEVGRWS